MKKPETFKTVERPKIHKESGRSYNERTLALIQTAETGLALNVPCKSASSLATIRSWVNRIAKACSLKGHTHFNKNEMTITVWLEKPDASC